MEVIIISRIIIKPSSSTPSHQRTYKLSLIDQLMKDIYFPIVLFYSKPPPCIESCTDRLKSSLAKTLTHYYPFAGRVKDCFSIDCDDSGVSFVEARVAAKMSELLDKKPDFDLLETLLPKEKFNLAVQVNRFVCGGMAISLLFRHVVVDAASAENFIKSWAAVASGGSSDDNNIMDAVFDFTSILPPHDLSDLFAGNIARKKLTSSAEIVTKMFVFSGSSIAALQAKIGNRTTRFEALAALMWGAVAAAAKRESNKVVAAVPINLRKRLNPPLPEQCIGNIFIPAIVDWPMEDEEEAVNYKSLARKLHESISMVNDECIRKLDADGWLKKVTNVINGEDRTKLVVLTSWCRFQFYEGDFGWGKPNWAAGGLRIPEYGDHGAVLIDSCDGEGVEAWVRMPKEDMSLFQQDHGILAHATFNPTI